MPYFEFTRCHISFKKIRKHSPLLWKKALVATTDLSPVFFTQTNLLLSCVLNRCRAIPFGPMGLMML